MIAFQNITKKYREKPVVDDVSLTLPSGKIIAFIGSNGAGKSTLLSIISRTLEKNSGTVNVNGKELSQWKSNELAKQLSILKQSNHLNVRLTVRELIGFGRFPYSQGRLTNQDKEKIDQAIAYMGLQELENRYIDELSGGQRQMAYIAMVIAQDTEYILLDEPLNNLDMLHSVEIMKVLRNLVDVLHKTVIIVIHDINFVSHYADYIVAMKDGKIVKCGETDDIIRSDVLKQIYNLDIKVQRVDQKNICLYYA